MPRKATHVVQGEGRGEDTLLDQAVDAHLALLLLAEHGGREDLVKHSRSLDAREVRLLVPAAQESASTLHAQARRITHHSSCIASAAAAAGTTAIMLSL